MIIKPFAACFKSPKKDHYLPKQALMVLIKTIIPYWNIEYAMVIGDLDDQTTRSEL